MFLICISYPLIPKCQCSFFTYKKHPTSSYLPPGTTTPYYPICSYFFWSVHIAPSFLYLYYTTYCAPSKVLIWVFYIIFISDFIGLWSYIFINFCSQLVNVCIQFLHFQYSHIQLLSRKDINIPPLKSFASTWGVVFLLGRTWPLAKTTILDTLVRQETIKK